MGTLIHIIKPVGCDYLDFVYNYDNWEYKIWFGEGNRIFNMSEQFNNYYKALEDDGLTYNVLFIFETDEI